MNGDEPKVPNVKNNAWNVVKVLLLTVGVMAAAVLCLFVFAFGVCMLSF